jgi:outer membrane protein TolC
VRNALLRLGLCVTVLFAASVSAHAQRLEQLINSALATHPSAQGQRALVQSAAANVDSAHWQFYPTPSVSIETAPGLGRWLTGSPALKTTTFTTPTKRKAVTSRKAALRTTRSAANST